MSPSPNAAGTASGGLWALVVGRFTLAAGFSLSYPFIAVYLKERLHLSNSVVAGLFAISGLAVCAGMLIGGELADRIGSRRVMLASLFARVLFALAYSACVTWEASFGIFAIVHVLNSVLFGLYEPASQALLTDLLGERERIEGFSLLRIGANAGWAIGPAVGGFIAERSYGIAFDVSAAAYLVAAFMTLLWVPNPGPARPHDGFRWRAMSGVLGQVVADLRFRRICLLAVFLGMTMGQLVLGMSLYCTQELSLPTSQIGWLLTLNGVLVVVLQVPISRALKAPRLTSSLALGSLLYAIGYAGMGIAAGFRGLAIAMTVVTLGEIIVSPTMDALAANLSPAKFVGRYRGVFSLAQQGGRVLGQPTCGLLLDHLPGQRVAQWLFLALPAAVASAGYLLLRRRISAAEEFGQPPAEPLPGADERV